MSGGEQPAMGQSGFTCIVLNGYRVYFAGVVPVLSNIFSRNQKDEATLYHGVWTFQ